MLVSGSAVGYYGASGDEVKTEDSRPGDDFLAHICEAWEAEAFRAASTVTRVVAARTGVVLERSGGALPQMMRPFRLFAGGRIGSGCQYRLVIHRHDWIEMMRWVIQTPEVTGPLNVTSPAPLTNRDFARALGRAISRPRFVPAPAFALKLALGEMASVALTGQRVLPARAQALGYHFRYPDIEQAFKGILGE